MIFNIDEREKHKYSSNDVILQLKNKLIVFILTNLLLYYCIVMFPVI